MVRIYFEGLFFTIFKIFFRRKLFVIFSMKNKLVFINEWNKLIKHPFNTLYKIYFRVTKLICTFAHPYGEYYV